MNMSLKTRIIFHHYEDYFTWTGKNFRYTDGEFVEATPNSIKRADDLHKFEVFRKMGTPKHKELSLKTLVWHNSRRVGYIPSENFQLRSPNSSPKGSPNRGFTSPNQDYR